MKVFSQILRREVYRVKNEERAQELVSQGINRGDIYTEWEVRIVKELDPKFAFKYDEAKQMFEGVLHRDLTNSTIS